MDYGIANKSGKPDLNNALEILNFAWRSGINSFDISPLYGNIEEIMKKFLSSKIDEKRERIIIISKLPAINIKKNLTYYKLYNYIKKEINRSLKQLGLSSIPIYLLHHAPDIFLENGLVIECLSKIREEGLINRFGLSVYNPIEVEESLKFKEIDVIQIPVNIFDHRLIKTELIKKLKNQNYLIFARSIYLQGIFFLNPENLPKKLEIAKDPLLKLNKLIKTYNIDIAKLALLFVRDITEIDSIIIGAENIDQIATNLKNMKEEPMNRTIYNIIYEDFSGLQDKIINPSLWDINI